MIIEIRVKREDRKRAEALLELSGIKVYKYKVGGPTIMSNQSIPIKIEFPTPIDASAEVKK